MNKKRLIAEDAVQQSKDEATIQVYNMTIRNIFKLSTPENCLTMFRLYDMKILIVQRKANFICKLTE